jgi:hypothetical protein
MALRQWVTAELTGDLGCDPEAFLKRLIDNALNAHFRDHNQLLSAAHGAAQRIRLTLGAETNRTATAANSTDGAMDAVRLRARALGAQIGESIATWTLDVVDARSFRVEGARQALAWMKGTVGSLLQTAVQQRDIAKQEVAASAKAIGAFESNALVKETLARALSNHGEHCLNLAIHESIAAALRAVEPFLVAASDRLQEVWRDLSELDSRFHLGDERLDAASARSDNAKAGKPSMTSPPRLADLFAARQDEFLEALDEGMERHFFTPEHTFRRALCEGGPVRDDFAAKLRANARKILLRAHDQSIHRYLRQLFEAERSGELTALLVRRLDEARPSLLDLGGAKRLLLRIPKELDVVQVARTVEKVAQERVSVSIEENGALQLCYEVEELPWEGIHTRLVRQRHDCQDLASRLHTRINIEWTVA